MTKCANKINSKTCSCHCTNHDRHATDVLAVVQFFCMHVSENYRRKLQMAHDHIDANKTAAWNTTIIGTGLHPQSLIITELHIDAIYVARHRRMNQTYVLRSITTAHLLQRPLVLTSVASRAFAVAAPTVWNSLSVNTRSADSEWVSSFLTAHRHILGYLVPYNDVGDNDDLLTALRVLNVDSNVNCLHLLTPLRTVQRHHNA